MHINSKYEQNLNLLMKYDQFLLGILQWMEMKVNFSSATSDTNWKNLWIMIWTNICSYKYNVVFLLQILWFMCSYYAFQFVCGMKSQVLQLAYYCRSTALMFLATAAATSAAEYLYCRRKLLPWYARAVLYLVVLWELFFASYNSMLWKIWLDLFECVQYAWMSLSQHKEHHEWCIKAITIVCAPISPRKRVHEWMGKIERKKGKPERLYEHGFVALDTLSVFCVIQRWTVVLYNVHGTQHTYPFITQCRGYERHNQIFIRNMNNSREMYVSEFMFIFILLHFQGLHSVHFLLCTVHMYVCSLLFCT